MRDRYRVRHGAWLRRRLGAHLILPAAAILLIVCRPLPGAAQTAAEDRTAAGGELRVGVQSIGGPLRAAALRPVSGLTLSKRPGERAARSIRQPAQQKRGWIRRHPAIFGTLVGFTGGFLIGYLPGDDAVFDDFTAEFNGLVLGGVGAGAGAIVGALAGRD